MACRLDEVRPILAGASSELHPQYDHYRSWSYGIAILVSFTTATVQRLVCANVNQVHIIVRW